jgi:hypothetical protein
MAPIFTYALHNKTTITDKAHIIVHEWAPEVLRDTTIEDEETGEERKSFLATWSDVDFITQSFGGEVQSVCGLKGILIRNETQNTEYFRRVFGKIDTVYFFTPIPRIDIKTRLTMDHDEEVTEDMICERCRENFEVRHRDIKRKFDI